MGGKKEWAKVWWRGWVTRRLRTVQEAMEGTSQLRNVVVEPATRPVELEWWPGNELQESSQVSTACTYAVGCKYRLGSPPYFMHWGEWSLGIFSHKSDVSYTKYLHMNNCWECTSSGYPDFNCQLSVMDKQRPLEDYASHSTGYSPVWEFWIYHCLSTSQIRTYLSNLTLGMGDRFAFQQTKASLKPCYLSFLWNEWKNPQSPTL